MYGSPPDPQRAAQDKVPADLTQLPITTPPARADVADAPSSASAMRAPAKGRKPDRSENDLVNIGALHRKT
jgi:hypothetical protein